MAKPLPNSSVASKHLVRLRIGKRIFEYDERQKPLGAGAMGVVYRGVDERGRDVAIKRVIDNYANIPEIRRRAKQEAEMMFSHPNLVEMLGYYEVAPDRGPIFIVSRLVKGENIDEFINRHIRQLPQAEKRICELFFPVLDALEYIHIKGIIHMDVKPSNIMMEQGRNVRLMDLGISNIMETGSESSSSLKGTPRYAAPEQFGDPEAGIKDTSNALLSPAADIYQAGVTLYELLSQRNPFSARSIQESRSLHQTVTLPPADNISKPILKVLRKATAIDPAKRYQHAAEMKADLQAALNRSTLPGWLPWAIGGAAAALLIVVIVLLLL